MPDKHFYFSIGASLGTAVSYYLIIARAKLQEKHALFRKLRNKSRHWVLYFPVLIFLVGLWGLIPDLLHASGLLDKEVTRGPLFNIFFFHSLFEQLEDSNQVLDRYLNWTGNIMLFLIALISMLFYIKIIKRNVRRRRKKPLASQLD